MVQFFSGFMRLPQIIGDTKRGTPGVFPVSKSAWWIGVKSGKYPAPVKLGPKTTAWRSEDIRALCETMARGAK